MLLRSLRTGAGTALRRKLAAVWLGDLPLRVVFWEYAVIYGIFVNVAATGSALIAHALEAPFWLSAALFLLPLSYVAFMTVAVWRSAAAYRGSPVWAELARGAVVLLALAAFAI